MKSKMFVVLSTLLLALSLMAQNAAPTTPASPEGSAKACPCCNHDQAKGAKCCAKGANCCKDGKCCGSDAKMCPMMSGKKSSDAQVNEMAQMNHDSASSKMACCNGKESCCAGGKCPMMSKGKKSGCCCGTMGEKTAA